MQQCKQRARTASLRLWNDNYEDNSALLVGFQSCPPERVRDTKRCERRAHKPEPERVQIFARALVQSPPVTHPWSDLIVVMHKNERPVELARSIPRWSTTRQLSHRYTFSHSQGSIFSNLKFLPSRRCSWPSRCGCICLARAKLRAPARSRPKIKRALARSLSFARNDCPRALTSSRSRTPTKRPALVSHPTCQLHSTMALGDAGERSRTHEKPRRSASRRPPISAIEPEHPLARSLARSPFPVPFNVRPPEGRTLLSC